MLFFSGRYKGLAHDDGTRAPDDNLWPMAGDMRIDVPPHDPFVYLMRSSAKRKEASMPRKRSPALKSAPAAAANGTAEVGKLVKKGILDKQPHAKHSRAVLIRLTPDGTAILHELTPLLRRINDRLFSGNRARGIDAVANFLHHIAEEAPNSIHLAKSFHPSTSVRRERQRKTVTKESRQ